MGALLFDGTDDRVKSTSLGASLAALSNANAATLLWVMKPSAADSDFDGVTYLCSGTGSGTVQHGFSIDAAEDIFMDLSGGRSVVGTFVANVYMMLITKPAGATVTCRLHWKQGAAGAWTHANFSGTQGYGTSSTMLDIGSWQGGDFYQGHQGIFAAWGVNFDDTQAEECDNNWRTSDLYNHSAGVPLSLIELNTLTPTDLGSSPAASLAVTGTTVSAETLDAWNFDGTGSAAVTIPQLVMPRTRL